MADETNGDQPTPENPRVTLVDDPIEERLRYSGSGSSATKRVADARYRAEHKEELRAYKAKWHIRNAQRLRVKAKLYYRSHKERAKQYGLKRRIEHKEEIRVCQARYRTEHSESKKLRDAQWRAKNRERKRQNDAAYRAAHLAKQRLNHARYYMEHRAERLFKLRQYYRSHPEMFRQSSLKRRAIECKAPIGDVRKITAWIESWRGKKSVTCYWCNRKFPGSKCHPDHVMPLAKGGSHDLSNLVVACRNCNSSKHAKHPAAWNATLEQPRLILNG